MFEEIFGAATARGKSSPKFSLNTLRWVYSHARGPLKTQIIKKCPCFSIHFLLNYFHYLDGTPVIRTDENTEEICKLDGEIRNKTVLKAGMLSGKLTHHKGVKDITSCIERCCGHKKCHVAMMMAGKCYSVFCTDPQYCEPKPAPLETHHTNPTVAYVKRGDISFGKTCICLLFSFDLGPCKYQPSQWTSHQPLTIPAHSIFYSSSSYLKEEMVGTQQCIPGSNTHVYTALPPYPGSSYLLRFLSPNNEKDTVIMIMFIMSSVYPRQYL